MSKRETLAAAAAVAAALVPSIARADIDNSCVKDSIGLCKTKDGRVIVTQTEEAQLGNQVGAASLTGFSGLIIAFAIYNAINKK